MRRRARANAADLGVPFSEYVRRIVARDLGEATLKANVSDVFDLGGSETPTNIARDKQKLIGEAVWGDHMRSIGRKLRQRVRKTPR